MAGTGRPDETADERALALLGEFEATYPGDVDEHDRDDLIVLQRPRPDARGVDAAPAVPRSA